MFNVMLSMRIWNNGIRMRLKEGDDKFLYFSRFKHIRMKCTDETYFSTLN